MSDTLIVSVSGVRGIVGTDLTPELVCSFSAAFGTLARETGRPRVVLARDARTSGPMLAAAARSGLQSVGCGVIECGLVPTPTAQMAVEHHEAGGGIVLTASHNPIEWNALKFIGPDGLFLDHETAERLRALAEGTIPRARWDGVGDVGRDEEAVTRHVDAVLVSAFVDLEAIRRRRFTVALDAVRGVGGVIMPGLLERLGCTVASIHMEPDGRFPRGPEPIPEHLDDLRRLVQQADANVGFAMDPDGDRLALTNEHGQPIGEDYTLALAVRAVLEQRKGPVVVNLSTSLVVDDAARSFGVTVHRAPVGEANVARAMRDGGAIIGGEGNGGVILPSLHFGRDAPIAAALVLDLMVRTGKSIGELVAEQPRYAIVKAKTPRASGGDKLDHTYGALTRQFADASVDRQDGLRLAWEDRWLHVRPSGTEPIVRLIAEARSRETANALVDRARELFEQTR